MLDIEDDANASNESNDDRVDGISSPCVWSTIVGNFQRRMNVSKERYSELHPNLKHTSSLFDIFSKMFFYSLVVQILYHVNQRLTIYGKPKKKDI